MFGMKLRDILNKTIVFLALLLCSFYCAVKPDPTPEWNFKPEAVKIHYAADSLLNAFNEKPHTLVLVVYQMRELDAFNDLAKTEEGLRKLLEFEHFDPSVVSKDKIIVHPGEEDSLIIDRYENARWVGIVAGYYNLIPEQVSQKFQIPFAIKKKGLIRRKKYAEISNMIIELILGSEAMYKVGNPK